MAAKSDYFWFKCLIVHRYIEFSNYLLFIFVKINTRTMLIPLNPLVDRCRNYLSRFKRIDIEQLIYHCLEVLGFEMIELNRVRRAL